MEHMHNVTQYRSKYQTLIIGPNEKHGLDSGLEGGLDSGLDFGLDLDWT